MIAGQVRLPAHWGDYSVLLRRRHVGEETLQAIARSGIFGESIWAQIAWRTESGDIMRWAEVMQRSSNVACSLRHLIISTIPERPGQTPVVAAVMAMIIPSLENLATLEVCIANEAYDNKTLMRAIGRLPSLRHLALNGGQSHQTPITFDALRLALVAGSASLQHAPAHAASGLVTLVLAGLNLRRDEGDEAPLGYALGHLRELRFADVVDSDGGLFAIALIEATDVERLEWSIRHGNDVDAEAIGSAFSRRTNLRSLIFGCGLGAWGAQTHVRQLAAGALEGIFSSLSRGALAHLHIGDVMHVSAAHLLEIGAQLVELSIVIDPATTSSRYGYDDLHVESDHRTACLATIASILTNPITPLRFLTVSGFRNEALEDVFRVCRRRRKCALSRQALGKRRGVEVTTSRVELPPDLRVPDADGTPSRPS